MAGKWQQCCSEAETCCRGKLTQSSSTRIQQNQHRHDGHDQRTCPPTWDGWACWPEPVEAATLARKHCPSHIYWMSFQPPPCRGKCEGFDPNVARF